MEKILLFEDFTKLYGRWKGGNNRKENDYIRNFISKQEHPEEFSITEDGKVNSNISVKITQEDLVNNKLPFEFGYVAGGFRISDAQIESLEGAPKTVGGDFEIWDCPKLTSLEFSPNKVGVNYVLFKVGVEDMTGCSQDIGGSLKMGSCDKLKSLVGSPEKINVDLTVIGCDKFDSIEGLPKEIGGDLNLVRCKKQFLFSDIPEDCTIKGKRFLRDYI